MSLFQIEDHQGILTQVYNEFDQARKKFPKFNSSHEGYAVLKEEVDEFWDEVKANDKKAARKEMIQVAAMAIRYLHDIE